MAAASFLLSEDLFHCPICLDVFADPVRTPCGHTYCKTCITGHWRSDVQWSCPVCKRIFHSRPELQVNIFFSEMVGQFRQKTSSSSSEQQEAGGVPCDVCTGTRLEALKTCLVCLVSYCQTHLEPHRTVAGLKSHQLVDPVKDLKGRICTKHQKPLELFCKVDQMCVCILCMVSGHKEHDLVPLKEEYEEKKIEIGKKQAEIQKMIQKKQAMIQQVKDSVELSHEAANRQKEEGMQVFGIPRLCVEKGLKTFIDGVEKKQKTTEKQSKAFIRKMEEEICQLERTRSEMERHLSSEDHLHVLQSLLSFNVPPPKPSTRFECHPSSYEGAVFAALNELEETLCKEIKTAKLKLIQQYAVEVGLDPDTAHPRLALSKDGKQVHDNIRWGKVKNSPKRFSVWLNVAGRQSFSSGKSYFEVQVQEKSEWYVGVGRQSMNRKGEVPLSPLNGYWTLQLKNKKYSAQADSPVCLSLTSQPQKMGVLVDYPEGLVSFYDVHNADLIYSFTGCSFTEKLYPILNPGKSHDGINSAPLIITPIILRH